MNLPNNLTKITIVVLCMCSFLFASETNKKRLYFGARLGVGIGMSVPGEDYKSWLQELDNENMPGIRWWRSGDKSFDIAPFVSLQITDIFAVQTEALFTRHDYLSLWGYRETYFDTNDSTYKLSEEWERFRQSRPALMFPILAKLTFHPEKYKIQLFAGPHFTLNYGKLRVTSIHMKIDDNTFSYNGEGNLEKSYYEQKEIKKYSDGFEFFEKDFRYPPVGLTAGGSFGIKPRIGTIFFDTRYITDFGEASSANGFSWVRRARVSFSVGYEFAAISR